MVISSERIKQLPISSGVYLMKDSAGEVIYVGKAKNVRTRVRSYFSGGDGRASIKYLLKSVSSVEALVTDSERQAILLEADLIKKYKPRYNVRLKDDRAHLVVRIDLSRDWPKLELVRQIREDGAKYFGPFAFSYEVRGILEIIKRTLPLRTCSDRVMRNRVRPCLEYQIKRCSGPCCLDVNQAEYLRWVEQAMKILQGKNTDVLAMLKEDMERASEELRFEDAVIIRDRIDLLKSTRESQPYIQFRSGARDAFGFFRENSGVSISIFSVRSGRLFEANSFYFEKVEVQDDEVLSSVVVQYYQREVELPEEILFPFETEDNSALEELFSQRAGSKVSVLSPKRGAKARLMSLARANAEECYRINAGGKDQGDKALRALQQELELEEMPRTIECVDISHFQGGQTVGSVVAFQDGQPDKERYRHFYMSQEGKPDDFASMREIVLRHLSRAQEENTEADLMVIDGGAQQLSQAIKQRHGLGLLSPVMIGLAKKRQEETVSYRRADLGRKKPERIFVEGKRIPVVLDPQSPAMLLLERIRDEAHRFAITLHRKRRSRRMFTSVLESIQGVGPKRRRRLLLEFGSVKAIAEARPEELVKRCTISQKLAEKIVETLKCRARENHR